MSFEKITKQHVLDAVAKIDNERIELDPSTKYDVLINDKFYPPKEVMRYANLLATGTKHWPFHGGEQTNKFLKKLGFNIHPKTPDTETINTEKNLIVFFKKIGQERVLNFFEIASRLISS